MIVLHKASITAVARLLCLACVTACCPRAEAQGNADKDAFPNQPIRWVVGFPAAGSIDSLARVLSQKLAQQLGQQIIVDNRAGAGGRLGAQEVARAKPDGYTQLLTLNTTFTIDRSLFRNLPYDPDKAFAPVTILGSSSQLLVTSPTLPVKNVAELIALAKAKPGQLTYASSGVGGSLHLAMLYLQSLTGIDIVHVPYKGGPAAVTDVMAGRVSMMFFNTPAAAPYVKNGTLRALGVSTATRSTLLPQVPTVGEAGVPGFDVSVWYGLAVPHGTPPAVIETMNAAVKKALRSPDIIKQLAALEIDPVGDSPDDFARRIASESAAWLDVFRKTNMKLE